MRKALLLLLMLLCVKNVGGQTLTHPQKVYIDPYGVGGADTLKIDGGLQAGPNGSIQVIAADGSISVSAALADGSINKIKLSSECTTGQILIRNSSGTPSYWDCGSVSSAGGIQPADNNITITGTGWRFQNATVFGSSTTAQELVHIYNSAGAAGLQLQNNAQSWKFIATGNNLQIANGVIAPFTVSTTQVGIFNTTPASTYELDLTGDFKLGGNLYVTGLYQGNIVPGDNTGYQTDKYDIGLPGVKWRNFYAASAIFDQFVQQNVLLYDGYLIVGKSSGKFSGAVSNVATTFVSTSSHDVNDFILVRGKDTGGVFQTEYFKILNKSAGPPYTYTITESSGGRNLDGSGANSWEDGTSYLVTGKLDDGRVEIYANSGIPRLSILSQNSTYSSFTEYVRLGGLDNAGGGGCTDSGRYGILLGLCSGNYLRYQNRISGGDSDDGILYVKGTIMADSYLAGNGVVTIDSSGLDVGTSGRIRGGRLAYSDTNAGFWLGYDGTGTAGYKLFLGNATEYLRWTGSDLELTGTVNANSGTFSGTITATGTISGGTISGATITGGTINTASSGSRVEMTNSPNALKWYNGSTNIGVIDPNGIYIPARTSGAFDSLRVYGFSGVSNGKLYTYGYVDSGTTTNIIGLSSTSTNTSWAATSILSAFHESSLQNASISTTATNTAALIDYSAGTHTFTGNINADSGTLYVDATNNRVGIGTTSITSGYEFDVNGDIYGRGRLVIADGATTGTAFSVGAVSRTNDTDHYVTRYDAGSDGTLGSLYFVVSMRPSATGTSRYVTLFSGDNIGFRDLVLNPSGTVRVNTITTHGTNVALDINPNGNGRVNFTDTDITANGIELKNWGVATSGWNVVCTSANSAGADSFIYYGFSSSSCSSSSIRYKMNVQKADFDFAKILDVVPVTFEYKTSPGIPQFGVIAEAVESLGLEPLVVRDNTGMVNAVNYDKVALYLIPIVKQQQERITELERRLSELENKKH